MSDTDEDGDTVGMDEGMEPESPTGGVDESDQDESDGDGDGDAGMSTTGVTRVPTPRGMRPISDKVRAMFKEARAKLKAQVPSDEDDEDISYDEQPDGTTSDSAPAGATAAPPAAPVATPPAGAPKETPPTPSLDPDVKALREQWSAKVSELDAREQAIVEREQASDVTRLRDTYFERGAPAIVQMVKAWTGLDGDELREEIADLVTDLSGQELGVALPSEVKSRIDTKRAQKSIKQMKADIAARETAAAEKAQREQEAAQRSRVIEILGKEITKPENASQYPYLSTEDNPSQLVLEVIERQLAQDGTRLTWQDAAKRLDTYLSTQASAWFDKRKHLLTASPAKAGGGPRPSTEGAPGRPPKVAGHAPPPAKPTPPTDAPPKKWSAEDHRRQTKQRMRGVFARSNPDD